jgi:hypothetical protein
MVMQELDKPRDTFVLKRGEYDKPGERVTPGVPAFLPPLPTDQPANRLTLARWLVDRRHPLTGRVTVNRYWQMIFGTGPGEDGGGLRLPGRAAEPRRPTRLAGGRLHGRAGGGHRGRRRPGRGWDVRRLIRTYVTSSTYRQASPVTKRCWPRDPKTACSPAAPGTACRRS